MDEARLVGAEEAARALGMTASSLYRMAANGTVTAYAVGPRLRGRRFDVQELRDQLRQLARRDQEPSTVSV